MVFLAFRRYIIVLSLIKIHNVFAHQNIVTECHWHNNVFAFSPAQLTGCFRWQVFAWSLMLFVKLPGQITVFRVTSCVADSPSLLMRARSFIKCIVCQHPSAICSRFCEAITPLSVLSIPPSSFIHFLLSLTSSIHLPSSFPLPPSPYPFLPFLAPHSLH